MTQSLANTTACVRICVTLVLQTEDATIDRPNFVFVFRVEMAIFYFSAFYFLAEKDFCTIGIILFCGPKLAFLAKND